MPEAAPANPSIPLVIGLGNEHVTTDSQSERRTLIPVLMGKGSPFPLHFQLGG
jgi:hypothetical protein